MKKVELFEMCRKDIEGRSFEVAVLPIGATEVHAWHLPFGNDAIHAAELARRAAERAVEKGADILVTPTIPFGCSPDVMPFPYTINVRPTTLFRLWEDLIASLTAHGIRKFMFLSGHGGNDGPIEAFRRELYGKYGAFLVHVIWWKTAWDVIEEVTETDEIDHADEMETSVSLELCPDLVRMDAAVKAPGKLSRLSAHHKYKGEFLRRWDGFTTTGGVGDPTKATREKGKKIVEVAVQRISDMLVELARTEHDETFPY